MKPPVLLTALLLLAAVSHADTNYKKIVPVVAGGTLKADGQPAAEQLRWGQTLATGSEPADVRIPGVAAFRMGPKSVLRMGWTRAGGVQLFLEKGGVLSAVRKRQKFTVRTSVAAATVRGTVFHTQIESPEQTYSCLCEGRYELTVGRARKREVKAEGHTAALVSIPEDGDAGLRHHTDDDVEALKELLK